MVITAMRSLHTLNTIQLLILTTAFYQERRDENDRLVGIPVAPIEYPGAPPRHLLLKFQILVLSL